MKRYIKSSVEKPYLYIFKHGIGPGTLPSDVVVVKTKDLPRGYTAVWTDRFLTTGEMDQYDIPYETEINHYLDRIGYCQKNGDVVPCGEVEACGDISCSTKVSAATNYDTKLIAKWLKAKFDDEAFGTAYTTHRISDADAYMGRNGLTYNRKNNTIDLWKSGSDEDIPVYKVVPQYSSTKRQGTYAPKLPKLIPIDEWNATHTADVGACNDIKASIDISDDQVKFFYKGKFLGACDPEDIECPKLQKLMKSDRNAATQILAYMNNLGDPVFPVSEEEWGTPETNIDNIDIDELYYTFMQELQYCYDDLRDGETFMVGADYSMPDFEIFTGEVAPGVDLSATTKYKADMVNCSEDEGKC